jgi:hypothetical protein
MDTCFTGASIGPQLYQAVISSTLPGCHFMECPGAFRQGFARWIWQVFEHMCGHACTPCTVRDWRRIQCTTKQRRSTSETPCPVVRDCFQSDVREGRLGFRWACCRSRFFGCAWSCGRPLEASPASKCARRHGNSRVHTLTHTCARACACTLFVSVPVPVPVSISYICSGGGGDTEDMCTIDACELARGLQLIELALAD